MRRFGEQRPLAPVACPQSPLGRVTRIGRASGVNTTMPTVYRISRPVRLFLDGLCLSDKPANPWPLDQWAQEVPNRFTVRDEGEEDVACTVEFDDDDNAYVRMTDIGSDEVCVKEIE
jgi:hypothetical protein